MTVDIRTSRSIRMRAGPCTMLGLLATCAAMPVSAAPGDQALEPLPAQSVQADQPAGAAYDYVQIAGSAFHPLDNTTTYSYTGSGCISKTGGPGFLFAHKLVLPEGAIVRYMRAFYFDNSTSTVTAFFTSYDGAGNFVEHTNVGSNTTGGFGTSLSAEFAYSVDQANAAINVVANLGSQNDDTLRFCGVRIAYDAPITDQIFANGFDPTPL